MFIRIVSEIEIECELQLAKLSWKDNPDVELQKHYASQINPLKIKANSQQEAEIISHNLITKTIYVFNGKAFSDQTQTHPINNFNATLFSLDSVFEIQL